MEDSVLTLSTATLASKTSQHTLQKMTDMVSEKVCNTSLVPIMESYITSVVPQVSRCMLSAVITVTVYWFICCRTRFFCMENDVNDRRMQAD